MTCSHAFCRAWRRSHVFTSNSHWFIALFTFPGWPEYLLWFWFYDTRLKTALIWQFDLFWCSTLPSKNFGLFSIHKTSDKIFRSVFRGISNFLCQLFWTIPEALWYLKQSKVKSTIWPTLFNDITYTHQESKSEASRRRSPTICFRLASVATDDQGSIPAEVKDFFFASCDLPFPY